MNLDAILHDLAEFLQVSFPQFSALDDRTVCGWFPGEGINCQTMTGMSCIAVSPYGGMRLTSHVRINMINYGISMHITY